MVADRDGESGWFISSAAHEAIGLDRSAWLQSRSLEEEVVDKPIEVDGTQ